MPAVFIVFEGIDGSGTTTQATLLEEYLVKNGKECFRTAEPTDGMIGRFIRQVLRAETRILPRTLQYLFFADREEHVRGEIEPALKKGKIVICDRYYLSSIAYAALTGDERPCRDLGKYLPEPEITFLFDLPVDRALERIGRRSDKRDIFEKRESLETIASAYRQVFNDIPDAKKVILDAERAIPDVQRAILDVLQQKGAV